MSRRVVASFPRDRWFLGEAESRVTCMQRGGPWKWTGAQEGGWVGDEAPGGREYRMPGGSGTGGGGGPGREVCREGDDEGSGGESPAILPSALCCVGGARALGSFPATPPPWPRPHNIHLIRSHQQLLQKWIHLPSAAKSGSYSFLCNLLLSPPVMRIGQWRSLVLSEVARPSGPSRR